MDVTGAAEQWGGFAMQLVSRGFWKRCEATRNAAVMAALGVPVKPEKCFQVEDGREVVTYLHEPASIFPHWQPMGPNALGPIKEVLRKFKARELPPLHPFMDGRRAIHNAELIYAWQGGGAPVFLGYEAGGERTRLADGGMPVSSCAARARVSSLAKAAALALVGFPLLGFEDDGAGGTRYVLPRLSVHMQKAGTPVIYDAAHLLGQERAGLLSPSHPFAIGCASVQAWLMILEMVSGESPMLMFRGGGWSRASFTHSQSSQAALDRAEAFAAGKLFVS